MRCSSIPITAAGHFSNPRELNLFCPGRRSFEQPSEQPLDNFVFLWAPELLRDSGDNVPCFSTAFPTLPNRQALLTTMHFHEFPKITNIFPRTSSTTTFFVPI
jgi:hypothetical protein